MFFALLTTLVLIVFSPDLNVYGSNGLLAKLAPFLAVIAPFFLASLAAVSTFGGPSFFDQPFDMAEPVTLTVVGEMGALDAIDITPRHFLSLLFGYCCVVALTLFIFSIFIPEIAGGLANILGSYAAYFAWSGLIAFLFLFYQVILATLLGIYYLSDKIHRKTV
jgi:hypothetical protein